MTVKFFTLKVAIIETYKDEIKDIQDYLTCELDGWSEVAYQLSPIETSVDTDNPGDLVYDRSE